MKAIPIRGRLTGKRIAGYLWAGQGKPDSEENYFQLEHGKLVSAEFATSVGAFLVRCYGATCSVALRDENSHVLGTVVLALPKDRRKQAVLPANIQLPAAAPRD